MELQWLPKFTILNAKESLSLVMAESIREFVTEALDDLFL